MAFLNSLTFRYLEAPFFLVLILFDSLRSLATVGCFFSLPLVLMNSIFLFLNDGLSHTLAFVV